MKFIQLHSVSALPEKDNKPLFINADNIAQMHRWPDTKHTYIIFVGNPQGCVKVQEAPEEIIALAASA